MRKGLTLTLMAVVVSVMGLQAMAMTPVVSEIRDIIVGDGEDVSASNIFVFPDAVNLAEIVTDDGLPGDDLLWSFYDSTETYLINGMASLSDTDDPVSPPTEKTINLADDETYVADENNVWNSRDTSPETITVRNNVLSPITGTAPYDEPGAAGLDSGTAVTLFCSDTDKAGSTTLFVFTNNEGFDEISGGPPPPTPVVTIDFSSSTNGWTYEQLYGSVTSGTSGAICMTDPAAGDNGGQWVGPYGETNEGGVSLVNNAVYRIRLHMTSTQTSPNAGPLWDMIIENQTPTGSAGAFCYGADYWFLDNYGGANAIAGPTVGRESFDIWWTPACVSQASWQSAAFATAQDAQNDMRLQFRTIDAASAGYDAGNDSGTICISSIEVVRQDISALTSSATVYTDDNLTAANWHASWYGGTTATFADGELTVEPTSSWGDEIIAIEPGDTDFSPGDLADNYPFAWDGDTLYKMEVVMRAPDANSETHPPDFIILRMDSASNELFMENYVVMNMDRAAMPKQTAATYVGFFYSHNASLASDANLKRLRAHLAVGALSGITAFTNDGGVVIESIVVKKIAQ
jgi:hypothetical protein